MKTLEIIIILFLFLGSYSAYSQEAKDKAPENKVEQADPEMKTASQTPSILEASGGIQPDQETSLLTGQQMVQRSTDPAIKTAASDPDPAMVTTAAKVDQTTQNAAQPSQVNAANSHLHGDKPD